MTQTSNNNHEEKIKLSLTYSEIQQLEKMKHLNSIKGKRGALHYLLHEKYTVESVSYEQDFLKKLIDFFNKRISIQEFNIFFADIAKEKKNNTILFFDSLFLVQEAGETTRKSYSIAEADKNRLDQIVSCLKASNVLKTKVTQSTVIRALLQNFEVYHALSDNECIEKLTVFKEKLKEMSNIFARAETDCLIGEIIKKYPAISEEFQEHNAYIGQLYEMSDYVTNFINAIKQKQGE